MRRYCFPLLTIIFLAIFLSACRGHPVPGELNTPLELSWNRFREIESENLRLAFLEVEADNRCPEDAECITSGDAELLVRILKDGARLEDLIVVVGTDPTPSYDVGDYTINVLDLQPGSPTDKKANYTLTIEIISNN